MTIMHRIRDITKFDGRRLFFSCPVCPSLSGEQSVPFTAHTVVKIEAYLSGVTLLFHWWDCIELRQRSSIVALVGASLHGVQQQDRFVHLDSSVDVLSMRLVKTV